MVLRGIKHNNFFLILLFFIFTTLRTSANEAFEEFMEQFQNSDNSKIEIKENLEAEKSLDSPKSNDITIFSTNENPPAIEGKNNYSGIILKRGQNFNAENVEINGFSSQTGGAIKVESGANIDNLNANFSNNSSLDEGGAIYNDSTINNIEGIYKNNFSRAGGGAIYNHNEASIKNIKGSFEGNSSTESMGGAISNFGKIENVEGNFTNNTAEMGGGAFSNAGEVKNLKGNYGSNSAGLMGGGILNTGIIDNIEGNFENNKTFYDGSIYAGGGAIGNFLPGEIKSLSGRFVNNYSQSRGGAIYNSGKMTLDSQNNEIYFSKNKDSTGNNAIYNFDGQIDMNVGENNITINDKIDGNGKNSIINIKSPNEETEGKIIINNTVSNNTINMYSGTIKFSINEQEGEKFEGNFDHNVDFNYWGGNIDLEDDIIKNTNLGNLTLYNDMNLKIDGNLMERTSDTLSVDSFTSNDHKINIEEIHPLNSCREMHFNICPFDKNMPLELRQELANSLEYTGSDIVETPLYNYHTRYIPEAGVFNFWRDGTNDFSPSVLDGAVASQLGGYLVQLNSYEEAFRNMNMYMLLPKKIRLSMKFGAKLASNNSDKYPIYQNFPYQNENIWLRPYSIFEKVPLKRGPEVSNTIYGSFFGNESEMKNLRKGWHYIWSPYAGYNGSHQSYQNINIHQNGGTLGAVVMTYKNNYFLGATLNISSSSVKAHNTFGKDNFNMLMGGGAVKTGYNFEFKEGRYIIQPNYLMSYTFVDTFSYTNSSGLKIKSSPLNAIQIAPGVQFIGNFENGFEPYLFVYMVWNVIDKTKFRANDTMLTNLAIKPFIVYGVGIRKIVNSRLNLYAQTNITNGGRNGIGLFVGASWELGKKMQ